MVSPSDMKTFSPQFFAPTTMLPFANGYAAMSAALSRSDFHGKLSSKLSRYLYHTLMPQIIMKVLCIASSYPVNVDSRWKPDLARHFVQWTCPWIVPLRLHGRRDDAFAWLSSTFGTPKDKCP